MSYLLDQTRRYDQVDFDVGSYVDLDRRTRKVEHIALHLLKTVYRIVILCPEAEIDLRPKVVGDLGLYRSQLMYEFFLTDLVEVPDATETDSQTHLAIALGMLGHYLEPREHGEFTPNSHITTITIPRIHAAQANLAAIWNIDPITAQLDIMERPTLGVTF